MNGMMRPLLLAAALVLSACGGGNSTPTTPTTTTGLNDADALKKLDAELAKPLPEFWKETSIAFITDPVAMCNQTDVDTRVKTEATAQLDRAKTALQDAGITVQESMDNAAIVFSIRILANCSSGTAALVTGDVSAMPGNGAVAAKSDLFEISRFDAGNVTLALLRNDAVIKKVHPQ